MSTQQPDAGTPTPPPDKPARWDTWDTEVTVEEVAAELAAYLDEVAEYVHRKCTPEWIERTRREIFAAVFGPADPSTSPDTC